VPAASWLLLFDRIVHRGPSSSGDRTVPPQIANPFAHRSDSFYFVDGLLIMHNKAEYQYGTVPQ
jgi:hypothetical protein